MPGRRQSLPGDTPRLLQTLKERGGGPPLKSRGELLETPSTCGSIRSTDHLNSPLVTLIFSTIVILEGEIGVGKTSMGNYIRHSKKDFFSPFLEIPCKPKWDNDTFMGIVLAAIVKEIMRNESSYKKLRFKR
jgi:hypothetical protein